METALGGKGEGAPQGVQAKERGAGKEIDLGEGDIGDEIPVHGVAEDFVDPHAVLIHREALGCAEERRGGEAAEAHVALQRIALRIIDLYSGKAFIEQVDDAEGPLQILAAGRLHRARHLVTTQSEPNHRGNAHDIDLLFEGPCGFSSRIFWRGFT